MRYKVPVRTLRDATQRILGDGSKVKGAIKKIYSAMQKMPKVALEKWRKYMIGLKNKDFFDNLRSAKLLNCLSRIPIRRTRDAAQRILGGGNAIKGKLQTLINGLNNIPKNALKKWRQVVQDIKDKKLFDNTRSAKLQNHLEKIPRRTMKEAHERLRGLMFAAPHVVKIIKKWMESLRGSQRKPSIGGESTCMP